MGRGARNSVFGVSNVIRFEPACSAAKASEKIEILLVVSCIFQLAKNKDADQAD